jgi:hypothetical protein
VQQYFRMTLLLMFSNLAFFYYFARDFHGLIRGFNGSIPRFMKIEAQHDRIVVRIVIKRRIFKSQSLHLSYVLPVCKRPVRKIEIIRKKPSSFNYSEDVCDMYRSVPRHMPVPMQENFLDESP